jgi:hypothetical protein
MWQQRQKEKFEAATANANKALDAGTDTEIKGKQQAFDFKQAIEKNLDDGRIQKMLDSLGEDIKADDVLRDIAKYESVAESFQGKTLAQKANIILGAELDGKQLTPQALVAIMATMSEQDFKDIGKKIGELTNGAIGGVIEALKTVFSVDLSGTPVGQALEGYQDVIETQPNLAVTTPTPTGNIQAPMTRSTQNALENAGQAIGSFFSGRR